MRTICRAGIVAVAVLTIPTAAGAADMAVKAPPAKPQPFSWTGFYIGGNGGAAWLHSGLTDSVLGINFINNKNGGVFAGGGQVGFNYQINNFVVGIEGNFDWTENKNNSGLIIVPAVGAFQASSNNRWISTLAARFGVVVYNQALFYGKAGGGWMGTSGFTVTNPATGNSITGSNGNTSGGWLAGGGIEWAFASNWTVKVEYDYLGLGSQSFTVPASSLLLPGDIFTTGNRNVQTLTLGINYLFNWRS